MKLLKFIRNQGLAAPVFALLLASAACVALVAYRVVVTHWPWQAYLIWNLFLAWLPLVFAVMAVERFGSGTGFQPVRRGPDVSEPAELSANSFVPPGRQDACPTRRALRDRKFLALGAAWLLFFPNAPYIFTDLVHVRTAWPHNLWVDLLLILLCALTGFLAGFLSLQVMHRLATRLWGRLAGWGFVAVVSALAGFGVYLGRFVRLNSWNVLTHPVWLAEGAGHAAWNVMTQWNHTKFLVLFSLFLLLAYVMLHALTLQRRAPATALEEWN
jgi:uncharacterized membrane protein